MKGKRFLGVLFAGVLALGTIGLAGCSSSSAGTSSSGTDTSTEETGSGAASSASEDTDSADTSESAAEETAAADSGEEKVLRVGAQVYPLYSSINAAHELGYIDEELAKVNTKVEWNEYVSGPLVNEAVAAGEEDIGFMADLPAIIAKSSGQDIQVVSGVATGEKSLAILVKADSDITDISQLKGKKIAYATGSYAQHLLALVLDEAGLTFDDIESINLGAADQPAALDSGEVDAIVIWEQYITKLTNDGTARVLIDGTGLKKSNMVVYSVREYAEENPEVIEAFIKAVDRGAQYIKDNPEDAAALLAPIYSVTEDEMEQILSNFTFSVSLTDDDIAEITKVADYAYTSGIIQSEVGEDFINTTYLKEAGY